jgi:hypothetical protein
MAPVAQNSNEDTQYDNHYECECHGHDPLPYWPFRIPGPRQDRHDHNADQTDELADTNGCPFGAVRYS